MTFDGDLLQTSRLAVGGHLRLLIGDLRGRKDTIRILGDLTHAFPFPADAASRKVHEFLGSINTDIVTRAADILRRGDAEALGALMTEAQNQFDGHLMPICPSELTAPRLHRVLADTRVHELSYGGKGVGSQGDGCVQLVARGDAERVQLAAYLREAYAMDCYDLDIKPPKLVRKAVIPAAGFGTRMFPATKAVKKEMLPLVTPDGQCKPILLAIVEEALSAGVDEVAIIVRAGDEPFYDQFFRGLPTPEHYNKLPEKARKACHRLAEMGAQITLIAQAEQLGFGHAVYCARDWVGKEPFLLLLGDHIYASNSDRPCARQLIDAFDAGGQTSVIGVYPAVADEVCHYGTIAGTWLNTDKTLASVTDFVEKPSADYARNNLVTEGLAPDTFLCVYGQYVLTSRIFEYLRRQIETDQRQAGEIQLTTALDAMRQEDGMLAYMVDGEHYDTGLPVNYLHSIVSYYERGQKDTSA